MNEEQAVRKLEVEHSHAAKRVGEDRDALRAAKLRLKDCQTAQQIVQEVARSIQAAAHQQMCGLVSKCLKTVYADEAYEFRIRFEKKRGKTEAHLDFVRGGDVFEPVDESGMGQIEVANFAMNLAEIMMTGKRRLVVADEPFKSINGTENRERLAGLLPILADELGFQFVICTGLEWLAECGKVVHIKKT